MNKYWSDLNKKMQIELKKKDTFNTGILTLLELRKQMMDEIENFKNLSCEQLCAIPFINAEGYHSKTILYSIYHIFRIEDIVVNSLINNKEQVFFKENYAIKTKSPIITTGNELEKQEIADFSKKLDINELFNYAFRVYETTNNFLEKLQYLDLKTKYSEEDKNRIESLNVVDEKAKWLIDYWGSKDIKGLIQMPLSRHWIMHIEAALRIKTKIIK